MIFWLVVFLATMGADYAWTKYIAAAAAKHPHKAAAWSAAIILVGAVNIISYTQNHWLIIPAVLGAYAGTWLAVWRDTKVSK